jgi:hypothetical protein
LKLDPSLKRFRIMKLDPDEFKSVVRFVLAQMWRDVVQERAAERMREYQIKRALRERLERERERQRLADAAWRPGPARPLLN